MSSRVAKRSPPSGSLRSWLRSSTDPWVSSLHPHRVSLMYLVQQTSEVEPMAPMPHSPTFTLFHEVAHLINRTSGLCALDETVNEEATANNFAANFLMPETTVRINLKHSDDPFAASEHLARHFKVSNLAAAVRLRRLDVIDNEDLDAIRTASEETWAQKREAMKLPGSFVPAWRLRYRDLSPTYIGVVARALKDRRIDLVDTTYLLNARLPMVEQILGEYYRTLPMSTACRPRSSSTTSAPTAGSSDLDTAECGTSVVL
ncbi:MAG: hypothetical protein B5766_04680 [Candidatus Lumbricidophila eiseniae]|uniref:IrrE N-terminal-like domain-containing protein n=1 Tax=Candidatus Lumbricidiphila eiseniae TaxID=1969409 RepID=A0A2A6FSA1_9MICO|nr:MAG: hypothetical protein B5766_04680 [Candidatus Lumbricidophila eiseniae]